MIDLTLLNPAPYPEDNEQLNVRRATLEDLPLVMRFDATDELMSRQPVGAERRLRGKIVAGDIYLAFGAGEVLGYARLDVLWPEMCTMLGWLWIEPSHRCTGLAAELRGIIFDELRQEGVTSILRSACTERPQMVARLYKECGEPAGRLRYENGTEEIFFWKKL